jgi:hypothetical protein
MAVNGRKITKQLLWLKPKSFNPQTVILPIVQQCQKPLTPQKISFPHVKLFFQPNF